MWLIWAGLYFAEMVRPAWRFARGRWGRLFVLTGVAFTAALWPLWYAYDVGKSAYHTRQGWLGQRDG